MFDLTAFFHATRHALDRHATGAPGAYRRWLWQDAKNSRDLGITVYGCADAAHVLYTLGALPSDPQARAGFIATLQSFQDPADGLFHSGDGHHALHTTAFCCAALELFDARPAHPLRGLETFATRDGLRALMDNLDWTHAPWPASHQGAGIYAAMVLSGTAPDGWEDAYFDWLAENQDPVTGLWRRGCVLGADGKTLGAPLFHHLASSFHYLFNLDYARRPLNHAERLVDTCIALHRDGGLPPMGRGLSWSEIDWLYTLRSLQKRTAYRSAECGELIRATAEALVASVLTIDPERDEGLNDLHTMFAGWCALAVAQEAVPGLIKTPRPLRLVLERRPFL